MDVSLINVNDHIQELIYELIELNDWAFYKVHLSADTLDYPIQPPVITVGHVLRCFGNDGGDAAGLKFTVTPAKGAHACGTLKATMTDPIQFYLRGSGIQLYLSPKIELWYLISRGLDRNAVKISTFDRMGLIFSDGRHRGVRSIIMGDNVIDMRMSDEEDDIIALHVVS
jgi:hypothetical protein